MPNHLLIVGGSDAGISAALAARAVSDWRITVVVADGYPNYSICGIPFYVGGEVAEATDLAHRTRADIEAHDIALALDTRAVEVDTEAGQVVVDSASGRRSMSYDSLVVGTGARSRLPEVPGIELDGVFPLRWIDEARRLRAHLRQTDGPVGLVGGGYVNLELAEAIAHAGRSVHLFERNVEPLKTVHPSFGARVRERLEDNGVVVHTEAHVEALEREGSRLRVVASGASQGPFGTVVVSTGAVPVTDLLPSVERGAGGALVVDDGMATALPGVWAAGACVHTLNRITGHHGYQPLGTTSHKQGRIAGLNAVGGEARYRGTCGTQIVRVLGLVAARSGLTEAEAAAAGFTPRVVALETVDHKRYIPGARPLHVRLLGDDGSGRLLGVQLLGDLETQAAKRIDTAATALHAGMTVEQLADLDLSYTPPLNAPWDPLQEAAFAWLRGAA